MTLQTSGAISLNDVKTEFGGGSSIPISSYYAGGSYVPSGTSGTNGAVPTSGTISLASFYGTSAIVISSFTLTQLVDTSTTGSGKGAITTYFRGFANTTYIAFDNTPFGALSPQTYTTPSGTKTIYGAFQNYATDYTASTTSSVIVFSLAGNLPNDANAFNSIICNGITLTRAGANTYSSNSTSSQWTWSPASLFGGNMFPPSANNTNVTFQVKH